MGSSNKNKKLRELEGRTILFIISEKKQVPRLRSLHNRLLKKNKIFVGVRNFELKELLKREGIQSTVLSDFVSSEANDEIDRVADEYSDNWYRANEKDRTIYRGISFGEVLKLPIAFHFMDLIKEIEGITNAIRETGTNVLIFFDNKPLLSEIAKLNNVQSYFLKPFSSRIKSSLGSIFYKTPIFCTKLSFNLMREKRAAQKTNDFPQTPVQREIAMFYYKGFKVLEPIRKSFYETSTQDIDILIRDGKDLETLLDEEKIPLRTFDYFLSLDPKQFYGVIRFISRFWKYSKNLRLVDYRGINLLKVSKELELMWKANTFYLIFYRSAMEEYLTKYRPQLVIPYIEVWPHAKLLVKICKSRGIKTLMVQHGVTSDKPYYKVTWTPSLVDKLAVWGEESKDYFVKNEVGENKVKITGCPLFDELFVEKSALSRKEVYSKYKIPKDKKLILFASQNFPDDVKRKLFYNVLDAARALDAFLIVKLHPSPRDTVEFYNQLLVKTDFNRSNILILKGDPLYPLLNACDVLVTVHSTVHVEAVLFDKNVAILHFTEAPDLSAVKHGAALCARNENETVNVLKKALYDPKAQRKLKNNREKFVAKYAYKNDGQATKRIVDLIHSMIRKSG